jgi:hypothetical protein
MRGPVHLLVFALVALGLAAPGRAAVTVQATIDPQEVNIGDEATLTYSVSGGSVEEFPLPAVDGLSVEQSSTSTQITMNGMQFSQSYSHTFVIVANRAGTIIIPGFDIHDGDGKTVAHAQALTLHVLGGGGPQASTPAIASPAGPVTMPPGLTSPDDQSAGQQPADQGSTRISVPIDPDGQPTRVFDVITPETTTAYVGQAVPLRIESYIRADANAQQDSLPTLIGSDFLMNNLSLRPAEEGVNVGNVEYIRDSWLTAIEAPRPGDFPLQATRDTYWTKSSPTPSDSDPFAPLFGGRQAQLLHRDIPSNKLVMHILPLPDQGRPPGFSGAIGKFQVSGNATPDAVGVGEPVTLRFTVTGQGNFDYVRSPTLSADPAWKPYAPTSKINYQDQDESHTHAMKVFEQALIPRKNGTLQLPSATFSYFDPATKQYVNVPVLLPPVTVTGEMAPAPAVAAAASTDTGSRAPAPGTNPALFAPNQLGFGSLTPDLAPAYRHGWFWIAQGLLLLVILAGAGLALVRPRADSTRNVRAERLASLRREEDAMDTAARRGNAPQFFASARRAVQLELAGRWQIAPESLTLAEIARRDAALGETVAPLFLEADDVIYSGAARSDLDLSEWNRRVREMLQPVRV